MDRWVWVPGNQVLHKTARLQGAAEHRVSNLRLQIAKVSDGELVGRAAILGLQDLKGNFCAASVPGPGDQGAIAEFTGLQQITMKHYPTRPAERRALSADFGHDSRGCFPLQPH